MFERWGVTFHTTPNFRYAFNLAVANLAWWGAFILTLLRTFNAIPAQYGLIIVLMIGIGINSGLSLSRMRLEKSILEAFRAGYKTMETNTINRENK